MLLRTLAIALAILFVGCGVQNGESGSDSSSSSSGAQSGPARTAPADPYATPQQPAGGAMQLAGISFAPEAGWTSLGPAPMRKATYQMAPVEGDTDPAEITVSYFGPKQGGTLQGNFDRWIGQMQAPDGGSAAELAVISKLTTGNGLTIHFIEIDGTYLKSMGGGPMTGGRKKAMEDHRMVGAIVEAPEGHVFFKLTGPVATAIAMEEAMRKMLGEATRL